MHCYVVDCFLFARSFDPAIDIPYGYIYNKADFTCPPCFTRDVSRKQLSALKLFRTIFIEVIAKCTYFNANQSSNLGVFISLQLSPNNPEIQRYKSPVRFSNSKIYAGFTATKPIEVTVSQYVAPTTSKSSQTWTLTMDSFEYDGTAHTPTISGKTYGTVTYTYYNADTNARLTEAPSAIGNYKVEVFASGSSSYYTLTRTAAFSITDPIDKNGMASVDAFKENDFNGKTVHQKMTKVYTALNAGGNRILPSVFSKDSRYMESYTLNNIPKSAFGKSFTVTPYFTTQDGTIVEGTANTFTIANMISK